MEIERKWLVDKKRLQWLIENSFYQERIEQHYLNSKNEEWIIRVRRSVSDNDTEYFLTLKSKGLLSREELQSEIGKDTYQDAIKHSKGCVKKTRYTIDVPTADLTYDIDVYDDYDFVTCEVEFHSESDAEKFEVPEWCLQDVTMDPKYKNDNLAK